MNSSISSADKLINELQQKQNQQKYVGKPKAELAQK